MKRLLFWPSSIILLLGVLVLPACGQQDTADVVSADCSGHIPREKVDACLERVRVIDETDPSAPLQSLEAELEQRARHAADAQSGPAGDASDQEPPQNDPEDRMAHDQGTAPDEQPLPADLANDQLPPPEGPRGDLSAPVDQTGPGDLTPPDNGSQGPPSDNTPPADNADPQGANR